jgi:hypothetical protein
MCGKNPTMMARCKRYFVVLKGRTNKESIGDGRRASLLILDESTATLSLQKNNDEILKPSFARVTICGTGKTIEKEDRSQKTRTVLSRW